jgi:hypothetical protein
LIITSVAAPAIEIKRMAACKAPQSRAAGGAALAGTYRRINDAWISEGTTRKYFHRLENEAFQRLDDVIE